MAISKKDVYCNQFQGCVLQSVPRMCIAISSKDVYCNQFQGCVLQSVPRMCIAIVVCCLL